MMYEIEIKGDPIAKKRPRFARRGKFVAVINDQQTEEGRFLFEIQKQWGLPALEGPLSLSMEFLLPIPQSTSKKKVALMLNQELRPNKKPDLDNLIKFSLDCLNGEVWKDDRQIISIKAIKAYSSTPLTKISIQEIGRQ